MRNPLHILFIDSRKTSARTSHPFGRCVLIGALVLQLAGSAAFGAASGARPFASIKGNFDNPSVVPVHSDAFGTTYEELAAKLWAMAVFDAGQRQRGVRHGGLQRQPIG
jgi:hypothetical protein